MKEGKRRTTQAGRPHPYTLKEIFMLYYCRMSNRFSWVRLGLSSIFLFLIFVTPSITHAQDFGDAIDPIGDPIDTGTGSGSTIGEQFDDIQNQGLIFAGICAGPSTPCDCRDEGRCTLDDILQVVINLTVFILGITGSLVLVLFIYGGFVWLTSGGSPERVKKGRDVMVGAVVGLIIIFGSYAIITLLISILKTGEVPESGENLEDVIGGEASTVIETSNE